MRRITGATKLAGVVGSPVAHSLSPLIHNAWLEAAGIDGVYVPLAVHPDLFAGFVTGLRAGPFVGVNVTLPFKGDALSRCTFCTERAARAQAANILVLKDRGELWADNTDGEGLLSAFAEQAPGWSAGAGPLVMVGAGGAAWGALSALSEAGASDVRVVNLTPNRAERLAEFIEGAQAFPLHAFREAAEGAATVDNATSASMTGKPLDLDLGALPADAVVMDMTYTPLRTPLLLQAEARGLRTVDGLAMLIGQARPSFEAFFGQPPPPEVDVRALCLAELERRA